MIRRILISSLICMVLHADETRVNDRGEVEAPGRDIRVFRDNSTTPLFGSVAKENDFVRFTPTLSLVPGETYRIEFQNADGTWAIQRLRFSLPRAEAPTVALAPTPALLPANALKLYLHFSQPMEQGVFLDRITLQRQDESIVHGAFRETELWSPDGKRLTLWLHPGRQKTGVNLNQDEGPVLIEGQKHRLNIHGTWRSTAGIPIVRDYSFVITASIPDHTSPDPKRWQITPPKAGTKQPLSVVMDEALDPAMLTSALRVHHNERQLPGTSSVAADARSWSFIPDQPWQRGQHRLHIDPLLEDLAGNNLLAPFEVNQEDKTDHPPPTTTLDFEVTGKS